MENFEVRDTRNGDWIWAYKSLVSDPHITPADKIAYEGLSAFEGSRGIFPSYESLAKRCALSVRKVKQAIHVLCEIGYVAIESRGGGKGHTNTYLLLKRPKGCIKCTDSNGAKNDRKRCKKQHANGAKNAQERNNEQDIEREGKKSYLSDPAWQAVRARIAKPI
ncbi:MAG: helix-turn-helix domain-containing protein [Parcubacteria group bacterium]|nr:helix-turn-helix domain-containing protein [Parcubacteria group bacterium]